MALGTNAARPMPNAESPVPYSPKVPPAAVGNFRAAGTANAAGHAARPGRARRVADGIRINDAAFEISPAGLEAIVKKQGAQVTLTNLDLSISPEALNTLLRAFAPAGQPPPTATLSDGRVEVTAQSADRQMGLDVRIGSFRLEITAEGLRLVSG